jgi:hypothetical protein
LGGAERGLLYIGCRINNIIQQLNFINQMATTMKRTFTQQPVIPAGYTGRDFNNWQKYLHTQIDKVTRPYLFKKFFQRAS